MEFKRYRHVDKKLCPESHSVSQASFIKYKHSHSFTQVCFLSNHVLVFLFRVSKCKNTCQNEK